MFINELPRTPILTIGVFIAVMSILQAAWCFAQSPAGSAKSQIQSCPPKGSPSSAGSPPLGYVIPHFAPPLDPVIVKPPKVEPLKGESEPFPEWAKREMEEKSRRERLEKERGRVDVIEQYDRPKDDSAKKGGSSPIDQVVQQINKWNRAGSK